MALAHYIGYIENTSTGKPLPKTVVLVYSALGGILQPVFADLSGTAKPLVESDDNGGYDFYIADGNYDIEHVYNGVVRNRITNIAIFNPDNYAAGDDLSGTGGAALVGTANGDTVQEYLDDIEARLSGVAVGTFVEAQAVAVPVSVGQLKTTGRNSAGDGGAATYVRWAAPMPALVANQEGYSWFESADGARWTLRETEIRLQMFGALTDNVENKTIFQRAAEHAAVISASILIDVVDFTYYGEVVLPDYVSIKANPGCGLKRPNEVRSATTSAIAAGTNVSRTVTVASGAGFRVGMTCAVYGAVVGGVPTISPVSGFSHTNLLITAVAGNSITLFGAFSAHAPGDFLQTANHMIVQNANGVIEGLKIDGNRANQTSRHWIHNIEIAVQGDNAKHIGLDIVNSASDAILVGGPEGVFIKDYWNENCRWLDCGGNGVHFGNSENSTIAFPHARNCNLDLADPLALIHNDGFVSASNDVRKLSVIEPDVEGCRALIGGVDSTPGTGPFNDEITVTGGRAHNCLVPIEVNGGSKKIKCVGTVFTASTPAKEFNLLAGPRRDSIITISGSGTPLFHQPSLIALEACTLENVQISVNNAKGVHITGTLDNTGYNGNFSSGNANVIVGNSSDIDIDLCNKGGGQAVELRNFAGSLEGRNIQIRGECIDQTFGGINKLDGHIFKSVTISAKVTNTSAASDAYRAVDYGDGIRIKDSEVNIVKGAVWGLTDWTPAKGPIAYDTLVDGVLIRADGVTDGAEPASLYTNLANTSVVLQSGDRYRITKTGGVADVYDSSAIGTIGYKKSFQAKITAVDVTSKFRAGINATPSANNGPNIPLAILHFAGAAYVSVNGADIAGPFAYITGEHWWILRRGTVVYLIEGGATPDAGVIRHTASIGGTLYFDSSLQTAGATFDVEMVGLV